MSNVRVSNLRTRGAKGRIKAFFNLHIYDLEIEGCKLVEGSKGPFVGFPSRSYTNKDGATVYVNIVQIPRGEDGKYLTPGALDLSREILSAAQEAYARATGDTSSALDEEDQDLQF